jgi:hypothetical protein
LLEGEHALKKSSDSEDIVLKWKASNLAPLYPYIYITQVKEASRGRLA